MKEIGLRTKKKKRKKELPIWLPDFIVQDAPSRLRSDFRERWLFEEGVAVEVFYIASKVFVP